MWVAVDAMDGVEVRMDVSLQPIHEWNHQTRHMLGDVFAEAVEELILSLAPPTNSRSSYLDGRSTEEFRTCAGYEPKVFPVQR